MVKIHKKQKKKREKPENNFGINIICVLIGVLVFVIGIVAPKTIMAMMDKGELNELYVLDVDTEFQEEGESLSVEEKLELLSEDETSVSVLLSDQSMEEQGRIIKMAENEIHEMQEKNIIPAFDLGVYDEKSGVVSYTYDGMEVQSDVYCACFNVVDLDNMNRYVSAAMVSYEFEENYLSILMDTDTGKIYDYAINTYFTEKEYEYYTKKIEKAMQEYLGISQKTYQTYYNFDADAASSNMEFDADDFFGFMSLNLKKSSQVFDVLGYR